MIVFLLLIAPCIFLSWKIIYRVYGPWPPIGLGIVFAAVMAGVVSWAVNAVLQQRRKKQRIARRKKARKQR
jgi:Co/Zn/Cd efflux system component